MNAERKVFSALISLSISLAIGVMAWWAVAAFSIAGWVPLKDTAIARAALCGLTGGVVLGIAWYRRNSAHVFEIPMPPLAVLYAVWSVIAFGFFMGFPFGAIALGWVGAVYLGRRATARSQPQWTDVRDGVRFICVLLGLECLAAGFFGVLSDPYTWRFVLSFFRAEALADSVAVSLASIVGLSFLLAGGQMLLAGWIAGRAFRWRS